MRTYKAASEYYTLRRWEWKLANRDELHQRHGWMVWAGRNLHPGYLIGGTIFMLIAGIDIVVSTGTELANPGTGNDKAAQFTKMLDERKKNQAEKRKQFDLIHTTTEQARGGSFPREQE